MYIICLLFGHDYYDKYVHRFGKNEDGDGISDDVESCYCGRCGHVLHLGKL